MHVPFPQCISAQHSAALSMPGELSGCGCTPAGPGSAILCRIRRAIWLNQLAAGSTTRVLSCLLTARMCRPMQPRRPRRRNGNMKMKKHPPGPHRRSP